MPNEEPGPESKPEISIPCWFRPSFTLYSYRGFKICHQIPYFSSYWGFPEGKLAQVFSSKNFFFFSPLLAWNPECSVPQFPGFFSPTGLQNWNFSICAPRPEEENGCLADSKTIFELLFLKAESLPLFSTFSWPLCLFLEHDAFISIFCREPRVVG